MNASRRMGWSGVGCTAVLLLDVLCGHRVEPAERLEVDYAGCDHVQLGEAPRCVFEPEAPIRLWIVHHDPSKLTVRVDGERWSVEEYLVEGMDGFGLSVIPPFEAEELSVESTEPRARWSLALSATSSTMSMSPSEVPSSRDVDAALGSALTAGLAGNYVEAMTLLDEIEELASGYPKGRADFAVYRGVVLWTQGRLHDAATSLREGVAFAMKLRDRELVHDALPTYAGILAELGYWDAAADWAEETLMLVRADPPPNLSVTHELFYCRFEGKVLSTLGYVHLLLARQYAEDPVHATALLEEALGRVGPWGRCPDQDTVPGIVLSLANAELEHGDPTAALTMLSGWGPLLAPTSDEQLRLEDVDLRARKQLGRPLVELEQSLRRFEEAVADAGLPEGDWRLAVHRGDILQGEGHLDEAAVAYREAEEVSQQLAELAAVGVARNSVVASHVRSAEQLAHLLAEDRPHDAFCVMREARARRIQAVGRTPPTEEQRVELTRAIEVHQTARRAHEQARLRGRRLPRKERTKLHLKLKPEEDRLSKVANEILRDQSTWRPSCEDLVPREFEELLLGIYPAEGGWFVFVEDGGGTHAEWLEGGPSYALDDPEFGTELLEPFEERLNLAKRVRVLATGRAQEIDVHLLQWKGGRLVESLPVVYGAELPALEASARPSELVALLVTDPTETLQMAPEEVRVAAEWMSAQGWTVDAPAPEDADLTRIFEGLTRASLFYFAGHGEQDVRDPRLHALPPYAGGTRDWSGRLRLKLPTELRVQDVLMLESAPRHVVLLGCETGVPMDSGGGMSLALAFLAAGAQEVVAAPVEADDSVGFATGIGLLSAMSGGEVDLAEGLRAAQLEMLGRGETVGRYRVLVR